MTDDKQGDASAQAFADQVSDQARRAGEALGTSGEKVAESGSTIGLKVIEQAEANTQKAFAAMRAAAQAKDPAEVVKIQSEFLREAGHRSMSQAREIGELIMQFGRDAVTPPRQN